MNVLKYFAFAIVVLLSGCQSTPMVKKITDDIMPLIETPIAEQTKTSIQKKNIRVIEGGVYVDLELHNKIHTSFLDDEVSYTSKNMTKDDLFLQLLDVFGDKLSIDPEVLRKPRGKKVGYISSFKGSKKEFLNYLCHIYTCSWNVENNNVFITHNVTKSWQIDLAKETKDISSSMDSKEQSGQNAQGGGQTVRSKNTFKSDLKLNPFEALKKQVESIVGKDGIVEVSVPLSMLTVTATHDKIKRIDQIVKYINMQANQLISINVDILTLKKNKSDERGTNFALDFNNQSLGANFNLINLGANDTGNFQFNIVDPDSEFQGSNALIQSISRNAEIVSKRSEMMVTLNGEPVAIKAGTIEPFFELTTTPVTNSNQLLQTITTKEVPIGFSLALVPSIINNGNEIRISMQLSDSVKVREERVTFGDNNFVEFPVTSSSDFSRTIKVRPGQYMMVAGRSNLTEGFKKNGTFHHSVPLLGGNRDVSNENEYLVVLINAEVIR